MVKIYVLVFLNLCLAVLIHALFEQNVCTYRKDAITKKRTILRKFRPCAGLSCYDRYRRLFKRNPSEEYYKDCCPGWTNKGPFGCLEKTCIVLPQDVGFTMCPIVRQTNLGLQKTFYKLTKPPEKPKVYLNETTNILEAVPFPLLNQPSAAIVLRSVTVPDLHEQSWIIRYSGMALRNQQMTKEYLKKVEVFTNYTQYAGLLKKFRDEQSKDLISVDVPGLGTVTSIPMAKYMRYPSQELPFKDIIEHEAWQNDDVFTQQRLAGLNPMALRKLTREDLGRNFINKRYDWNAAMKRASGKDISFEEMVDGGVVFIVDYVLLHNISNVEDYTDLNPNDRREMRSSRSPFCIFVSANVGGVYQLKPVAIQTDLHSRAPVFSPIDGSKWLLAKVEVQRADITYAELIEHLLKTHLVMEPICVIMRRHLSEFHPLHQILKWHCRGLFVTNSLGIKALLEPKRFLHILFTIGHVGGVELLNKAYPLVSWADTEFEKNLQKRGVDDLEKLPYFPYRDDGLLIWKEVGKFSENYVNLYYKDDTTVKRDQELQNFANELSADGIGEDGGNGMYKGFPSTIITKSQLIDVVKRIVFIPVQHHAVNYPVVYYAGYVPNLPTKLYDDPRVPHQEFSIERLPQAHVATYQVALSMSLGSIRYDVLFDYWTHLRDNRAKAVVKRHFEKLIGSINDIITERNHKRLKLGKLSYPYLLPKWMPNSIHT